MGEGDKFQTSPGDPSQNARRHGLTALVPSAKTCAIYREILNNPAQCAASYATHKVTRLAWEFAECEAQVERTMAAEREHLFGGVRANTATIEDFQKVVLDAPAMRGIVFSPTGDIARVVATAQEALFWKAYWKKADLLKRYRREAETKRLKAQTAYISALVADDPYPPE